MHSEGSDEAPDPQHRDPETLDRELDELSGELRMVIPGVTVLLAFLLTMPVASGFPSLTRTQQNVYFAALLSTTLAVPCLLHLQLSSH